MKNLLKILVMVSVGICIGFRLNATELPVRYKSGSLNTTPRKNTSNWVSTIEVRYGQAETRDGFDFNGERTSALNIFGSTDLIRLGYGLENLTNALPQTNRYWTLGYDSVNNPLPAPRIAAGVFDNNATNPIKTTGRVSSSEFALNLEQNFFSGFFGQCYIPFRQLSVDKIGFEVIGNQNMPGGVGQVSAFVEQQLPTIMREQGIESLFSSYKKQAISEILLGCGWQGFNNQGFGIIDDASGRVFVGAIIPGAGSTDSSYLAGLPLGYDGFWGVHTRIELEVGVRKCLAFGASSSVNIFFTDTRTMRVMSDVEKKQSGFLSFAQARVGVDQGSVWDAAVFMKIHKVLNGLVAQAGYSFSRQEAT
ncbi:hypothetical protein FJ364_02905, partial [Candidatus Dependentiae bacterium]|nr:hypothetical protein [Candidatus Dependentiae bacterium]